MSSCQRTERCCAIGTELPLSYAPIWLPLVHGPSGCGAVCTTAPLGVRFPTEQCEAAPAGLIASLESMPTFAWLQIMLTTCMMETGYFLFEYEGYPNAGNKAPGDIGGDAWVRYDDPETKTFKLNVERQNGRAAMLGVFGCILHELVGVDALYPTGGLGNGAPPTIF